MIVCPGESALAERCAEASIPLHATPFPPLAPGAVPRMPPAVHALGRILKDAAGQGGLVVGTTALAQAYLALAALTVRGEPPIVNLLLEQDTARRASARLVFKRSRRLVAIGENTAATYRAAVPGVPIGRLNNFLDPRAFHAPPRNRARPDDAPPALGFLGRLIADKGALDLVEELAASPSAWSQLIIVGDEQDAGYVARLRSRIDALGLIDRVILRGHVRDIDPFFDEIDALVVPSTGTEGQPTVIVEALARGLPVIVRRPIWSPDFAGLPVLPYSSPAGLEAAIAESQSAAPAGADELARRFGPQQALDALIAAGS